jgi:hypothetical protein
MWRERSGVAAVVVTLLAMVLISRRSGMDYVWDLAAKTMTSSSWTCWMLFQGGRMKSSWNRGSWIERVIRSWVAYHSWRVGVCVWACVTGHTGLMYIM